MRNRISILLLLLMVVSALHAQSKEDLQQQKQKAFDDIKMTRELMEKTTKKRVGSVQQLRLLQKGINSRAELISALESEVKIVNREIEFTKDEIKKLEAENELNKQEYARLIYYAYRNHSSYEKLMYILAGSTISQSYQRYKYLKYISEYRIEKAHQIEQLMVELDLKRENLLVLRSEKLDVMEEKDLEQEKLIGQRGRQSKMVKDLSRQESGLRKQIKEKERIARELEAEIRKIIEEEARKVSADNIYAALTPEQELVGNDFRKNKGKLPWPVDKGIITTGFGDNEFPGLVGTSVKNNGIDINSAPGTKVRAVFDGEVTKVFAINGANYTVLIRHGQFLTVYQNLVNVRVKSGDKVLTKESLGDAFTDQTHKVSMVHFEVWQERNILNPEAWLSK
jgi:septal ring factor EnvC (AmiA/AmiB activator)